MLTTRRNNPISCLIFQGAKVSTTFDYCDLHFENDSGTDYANVNAAFAKKLFWLRKNLLQQCWHDKRDFFKFLLKVHLHVKIFGAI